MDRGISQIMSSPRMQQALSQIEGPQGLTSWNNMQTSPAVASNPLSLDGDEGVEGSSESSEVFQGFQISEPYLATIEAIRFYHLSQSITQSTTSE